jgi:hypothetical protein
MPCSLRRRPSSRNRGSSPAVRGHRAAATVRVAPAVSYQVGAAVTKEVTATLGAATAVVMNLTAVPGAATGGP